MDIPVRDLSANDFYKWFNDQFNHIEHEIKILKTAEEKSSCLDKISKLTSECRNVRHHLSQHDQKLYSDQLQKLQEMAENSLKESKPRFSFRRKLESATRVKSTEDEENQSGLSSPVSTDSTTPSNALIDNTVSSLSPASYHIADQTNKLITNKNHSITSSILKLSNIANSIIFFNNSFNSIKLDNITTSIILVTSVNGPIYASNIQNSIIIANCHQLRIHKSNNSNLYLSCRSKRPIIENCSKLGFGQYPLQLQDATVDIINWIAIDDFNWIRKTQSINWYEIKDVPNFQWLLELPDKFDITTENNLKRYINLCIDK